MKVVVVGLIASGAFAISGCAASDQAGLTGDCIILANGGNKLCGEDAKAWCASTDDLRQGEPTLGVEADTESQAVCDSL